LADVRNIQVADIEVILERKAIRHCYIRVKPPAGEVRVSAGPAYSEAIIRDLVEARLPWIRRQRERLRRREAVMPTQPELIDGSVQRFRGQAYTLCIVPSVRRAGVERVGNEIRLWVDPDSHPDIRRRCLEDWYRREMKARLPELIRAWEPIMGVQVAESRVRRMKTLWGSCNPRARRIWLNLDLIRHADACLEYVLVHEMVHLLERGHNRRFYAFMDRFLPDWRMRREQLNGPQSQSADCGIAGTG